MLIYLIWSDTLSLYVSKLCKRKRIRLEITFKEYLNLKICVCYEFNILLLLTRLFRANLDTNVLRESATCLFLTFEIF